MKYRKRKHFGILLLLWMILLMAGCGEQSEESKLETEICSDLARTLSRGESMGEINIEEKEKARDTVRYHVYCRMETEDDKTVCEKCYLITYRRRNGKWVCDEKRGVRLVEEKVVEAR